MEPEEQRLLKEIGLSSYETAAYLKLVELGTAEASVLYKKAGVPFGRIYEELNSLVNKGLVEVQNTRPKRYMAKKPGAAFRGILKKKKDEMDAHFQKTVHAVTQLEDKLSGKMPQKPGEKAFWTVAVGNYEIAEMMKNNFDEAEKELCIISRNRFVERIRGMLLQPQLLNSAKGTISSVNGAIKRGVKIRGIISGEFAFPGGLINKLKLKFLLRKAELRTISDVKFYYEICDSSKVMIKVDNPANPSEILAAIRIYDLRLAKEMKEKFEELWNKAKPASA